jgi:hypothetical protein
LEDIGKMEKGGMGVFDGEGGGLLASKYFTLDGILNWRLSNDETISILFYREILYIMK